MKDNIINDLKGNLCRSFSYPQFRFYYDNKFVSKVTASDGGFVESEGVNLNYPISIIKQENGDITLSIASIKGATLTITEEEQKEYMKYMCQLIDDKSSEVSAIMNSHQGTERDQADENILNAEVFNMLTGKNEYANRISSSENLLAGVVERFNDDMAKISTLDTIAKDDYAQILETPASISEQNVQREDLIKNSMRNLYLGIALNNFYKRIYQSHPKEKHDYSKLIPDLSSITPKNPIEELDNNTGKNIQTIESVTEIQKNFEQKKREMYEQKSEFLSTEDIGVGKDNTLKVSCRPLYGDAEEINATYKIESTKDNNINIKYKSADGKTIKVSFKIDTENAGNSSTFDIDNYSLKTCITERNNLLPTEIFSDTMQVGKSIWRAGGGSYAYGSSLLKDVLNNENLFDSVKDENLRVILRRAQKDALKYIEDGSEKKNIAGKVIDKIEMAKGKLAQKDEEVKTEENVGQQTRNQSAQEKKPTIIKRLLNKINNHNL